MKCLFQQVLETNRNQGLYMIVCKIIYDGFSFATTINQIHFLKFFQLVGDGGLFHAKQFADGTDTKFRVQ